MARIVTLTANPALDYYVEADAVAPNHKIRCDHARADAGGGGINVARAAHRLGAKTVAIFPAGGPYGAALVAAIEKEAVPHRVIPIKGETRIAFAARDRAAGDEYRFGLAGPALSSQEIEALLAAAREETKAGDFVIGSGSLPPGAPADFWARAAKDARKNGAKFALDSSMGESEALAAGLYLLRKNKLELANLAGRALSWPNEVERFAHDFVSKENVEKLVVTHGADGALMASADGSVLAPAHDVVIVSAVGAGDSFVAALIDALMRGESDARALRWGMAAASATLTTPGTALFDPAMVEDLFERDPRATLS
ncbi:MAG TPA: 1-phosphofructokinase family hexose kinase [Parvularculaceae bacterium]|nr:1-phosphofructokinase family hexose kinase [Parvularculaceae bacterium]